MLCNLASACAVTNFVASWVHMVILTKNFMKQECCIKLQLSQLEKKKKKTEIGRIQLNKQKTC